MLALQPSFVFFTRQGIYVTNTTVAISLAILLALWRLMKTGRYRWWYLVAFLAGLGMWAKFIMLWALVATVVLAPLVWFLREQFELDPAADFDPHLLFRPRPLLLASLTFLSGLSPFLLFNWQTGATFSHFWGTLGQSYYGVENTDYLANLSTRWGQIGDYLQGNHFWYLGGNFIDSLARPVWLLGFVIIVFVLIARRRDHHQRAFALRSLFYYAYFLVLFIQTPLTPTVLWYTHLAFFSPFLALGAATAWDLLFRQLPSRAAWAMAFVFAPRDRRQQPARRYRLPPGAGCHWRLCRPFRCLVPAHRRIALRGDFQPLCPGLGFRCSCGPHLPGRGQSRRNLRLRALRQARRGIRGTSPAVAQGSLYRLPAACTRPHQFPGTAPGVGDSGRRDGRPARDHRGYSRTIRRTAFRAPPSCGDPVSAFGIG